VSGTEVVTRIFQQLPNAKVPIHGLSELRKYLSEHMLTWNGRKVVGFSSFADEMYVKIEVKGVISRHFYGIVDDVAYNVQSGFYEGGTK